MSRLITTMIANITMKNIKYLRKHYIEVLEDKEGNIIDISRKQEILKAWQEKPIEIKRYGKEALLYKNKTYYLGSDKE